MLLARVFLMPGLVGLAILDAGAAGLPLVTTDYPWHSPEIAYLDPGVNGLPIRLWRDPGAYVDAVAGLLADSAWLASMRAEAIR